MIARRPRTCLNSVRLTIVGLAVGACGLLAQESRGAGAARTDGATTYTRDVAPIIQGKCQGCHRRGEIGPFALETYEQARKRASFLADVVEARQMPPWMPEPGVGPKVRHDLSLSVEEIATFRAWADAGAPLGDESHMPAPPVFADGWKLGTPDLVLQPDADFPVPASGPDIYRCFVIPTNFPGDGYLSAIEFRAGNRRVVHHMSAFIDAKNAGRRCDAADPGPGYTSFAGPGVEVYGELGFWAAGNEPGHLPPGVGFRLPRHCDVILQVHYHPSGKPETDRPSLGLHFSREPVRRTFHWNSASNYRFRLPAGRSNIEVRAHWDVPVDVELHAVAPHMHQLGRDIRMSVTYPGGRASELIHIPDWDPAWQNSYYFEKPIHLPKGSIVQVVAHFDNSAHPRNPHNPPRTVMTGYGVDDEMLVGYLAVTKAGQDLTQPGEVDDLYETFERQRFAEIRYHLSERGR